MNRVSVPNAFLNAYAANIGAGRFLRAEIGDSSLACVVTMPMTLIPSMLADLSDDQEQRSGERQEGVLASITSFAMKLTSSVGLIAGGLMLDYFIEMPAGAAGRYSNRIGCAVQISNL